MKNEKGTIVLAGGVIGLIAAILVFFGNPANMGFCIACFLRDTTGALGLHSAAAVQYIRPEIIGLVLGACIISLAKKEFRPRGGSAPVTRFTPVSYTHLDVYKRQDYKYIYEEDQEEYLKFCSIDNLRRELAKGRERIYLNYRTLIKQEYRWVCMEVIRSAEYKPDDQIAMMYIRDINDEYLKQLDKIIRHAKDAFASVTVNISDGSCIMANSRIASLELKDVNEPLDSYIERISQSIPQREVRTQYRKVFCVDNLRECLTQGKDMIQWECPVYAAKGISLRMIRTTVEMVRNVSYDRLEALIYFSDITENYFSEQIPHMLYRKNFDRIEIIDGQRDCVRLDHPGICAMEMVLAEEISYSGYVTEVMKKFVPDDEKSVYEKCVRLDTIRKELQEKDRYLSLIHILIRS